MEAAGGVLVDPWGDFKAFSGLERAEPVQSAA